MSKEILVAISIFLIVIAVAVILFVVPLSREMTTKMKIGENIFVVEVADTVLKQVQGLSGRNSLGEGKGMLFVFDKPAAQTFWMKGMNFPLDMVWIKDREIIGFEENAQPDNSDSPKIYSSHEPVDKVLEVNAGTVSKIGIQRGQAIEIIGRE